MHKHRVWGMQCTQGNGTQFAYGVYVDVFLLLLLVKLSVSILKENNL